MSHSFTPVPDGEISVYVSSRWTISAAHDLSAPLSGSKASSRSMPQNSSVAEKTNPMPAHPWPRYDSSASSNVAHVNASVALAFLPVFALSRTLVHFRLPSFSRSWYSHTTH